MTEKNKTHLTQVSHWIYNGRELLKPLIIEGRTGGNYTLHYENGFKLLEGEWQIDVPHGRTRTWYPDGGLMHEIELYNGKLHGRLKIWNEAQEMVVSAIFELGDLLIWTEWDEKGDIISGPHLPKLIQFRSLQ